MGTRGFQEARSTATWKDVKKDLRKTKIGTEVAHVTRDSDTTFKVKRSTCMGGGICGGLPHSLRHIQLNL